MYPPGIKEWHNLTENEVIELWSSNQDIGLDLSDAENRLNHHGPNTITTQRRQSSFVRFLLQFHQPLIYILIVSGVITALLQEWVDSSVIFGVVLANATVGYIQESKAVNALAALAKTMTSQAMVLRQGHNIRLDATLVVPGDIVLACSEGGGKPATYVNAGDALLPARLKISRTKLVST